VPLGEVRALLLDQLPEERAEELKQQPLRTGIPLEFSVKPVVCLIVSEREPKPEAVGEPEGLCWRAATLSALRHQGQEQVEELVGDYREGDQVACEHEQEAVA
jgi:hypothetical protein